MTQGRPPDDGDPSRAPWSSSNRRAVARVGAPVVIAPSGPLTDAALIAPLGMRAPHYLFALQGSEGAALVQTWLEIGEALVQAGRLDRAKMAWERGLTAAERSLATRGMAATFFWRLGQLAEGTMQLVEGLQWYERAADAFRREGAHADEAVARMALARVAFHASGGGEARQHARDAVAAARELGPDGAALLGEALEITGEVLLDLGQTDEALASLREAMRQHERARLLNGGTELASEEVRTAVVLAEGLLEAGQVRAAAIVFESIEAHIEGHESPETRGRGMGVMGLLNLELGRIAEAAEPIKKALEWLDAAGATLRRARLHLAIAKRIERTGGVELAKPHYEKAWMLALQSNDRFRLAPIGYALAFLYSRAGEWVRADLVIEDVLPIVQDVDDLEGLVRCTELAVRIALKLAQGKLALDRLLLLARTRGRLGDVFGQLRGLRTALAATLAVPGLDPASVCGEFMESLRQTGTVPLGPGEAMETAAALAGKQLFAAATEIATIEAEHHVAEGRRQEGARTFAKAAGWCLAANDRWGAVELWDRAIDLGEVVGMDDVKDWIAERGRASV